MRNIVLLFALLMALPLMGQEIRTDTTEVVDLQFHKHKLRKTRTTGSRDRDGILVHSLPFELCPIGLSSTKDTSIYLENLSVFRQPRQSQGLGSIMLHMRLYLLDDTVMTLPSNTPPIWEDSLRVSCDSVKKITLSIGVRLNRNSHQLLWATIFGDRTTKPAFYLKARKDDGVYIRSTTPNYPFVFTPNLYNLYHFELKYRRLTKP